MKIGRSTRVVLLLLSLITFAAPAAAQTPATVAEGVDALGAFTSLRLTAATQFTSSVSERFTASRYELHVIGSDDARDAGEPPLDQEAVFDFGPGVQDERWGAWVDAGMVRSTLDGSSITNPVNGWIATASTGFDRRVPLGIWRWAGDLRIGGALGYDYISFDTGAAGATRGTGNTMQFAGHAAWSTHRFYAGLIARYAHSWLDTERSFDLGTVQTLGSISGNGAGTRIEAGALIGDPAVAALRPILAFDYAWIGQDAFSETGGGSENLSIGETSTNSMVTTVGLRLSRVFAYDHTMFGNGPDGEFGLEPEIHAFWHHEFGDRGRHIDVTPTAGSAFRVPGAESRRDYFTVGFGYVMRFQQRSLLSLRYDARLEGGRTDHALRLGLIFHW
jgi:uncharacterized protein with beta-barrel porin domain